MDIEQEIANLDARTRALQDELRTVNAQRRELYDQQTAALEGIVYRTLNCFAEI